MNIYMINCQHIVDIIYLLYKYYLNILNVEHSPIIKIK